MSLQATLFSRPPVIPFSPRLTAAKFRLPGLLAVLTAVFLAPPAAHAVDANWNVNNGGNWSTAANWTGSVVPGGTGSTVGLTFNISAVRTVTIDTTSRTVGTLNIGDSASTFFAYTLNATGGASLIMDNGASAAVINHTATGVADVISAPISLVSNLSLVNASGNTLTLSGPITGTAANTLTNSGTGSGAVVISGAVGANVSGIIENSATSALTLSGNNTFGTVGSTGVTLTAGTLNINASGATSADSALGVGTLVISGGTLNNSSAGAVTIGTNNAQTWNGDFAFTGTQALNLGTGAVSLGTNALAARTVTVNASTLTVGGVISNGTNGTTPTTALTKAGNGTLALSGASTYSGVTTVTAGTLSLTGSLATSNIVISGTGAFNESATGTLTTSGLSITQGGTGFSTLSGVNTYTGGTAINGGTVVLSKITSMPASGTVAVGAAGTLGVNVGGAGEYTTATSGAGSIGGLVAGVGGQGSTVTFASGGALGLDTSNNGGGTSTYAGVISTAGLGITKLGSNTLELSAANTYTGQTTVSGGTLSLTGSLTGSKIVTNGTGVFNEASGGVIAGTGIQFTQSSTATSILSGVNTWSGGNVTVASGSGNTVNAGAILSGTGTLSVGTIGAQDGTVNGNGIVGSNLGGAYSNIIFLNGTATLQYTGTGETTNRQLFAGAAGAVPVLDQSGSGLLKFTGNARSFGANGSGGGGIGLVLQGSTSGTGEFAGNIVDNFTTSATFNRSTFLTKDGTGTWVVSGANNYSGGTTIKNGILSVSQIGSTTSATSNLGGFSSPATSNTTAVKIGSTATTGQLTYTGPGETTDRVVDLSGTTGGAVLDQSGSGLLKFTSSLTASGAGSKNLTLQGSTAGSGEISGSVNDNSGSNITSVVKAGTGTWTLSGANNYTGTTTVNGGTLLYNGTSSFAALGTTVNGTGTLGGTGTLQTVQANSGGTVAPGAGGIGTLNAASLSLLSGSTLSLELNTGALSSDLLNIGGPLSLASSGTNLQLSLVGTDTALPIGQVFTLANYGSLSGGLFTYNSAPLANGSTFSLGLNNFRVDYLSGNAFTLVTAVPEPSTYLLLAMGLTGLLVLRRQRSSRSIG